MRTKSVFPFSTLFSFAVLGAFSLVAEPAHAQFNVIEHDGGNRLQLFGVNWAPSFFSLATTETDKMNDEGGRLSTYNYFTFATHAGDYRFALRLPFQYNSAGTDRFNGEKQNKQEMFLQDIIVCLQTRDIWFLPWDIGSYWEGRIYLPTSQVSRDSGLVTRFRNEFIFTKFFNRYLGLEYDQQFSFYWQSKTAYANEFQDENGFTVNATSSTKRYELNHWMDFFTKVTHTISVGWELGERDTTWNPSAAANKNKPPQHLIRTGPQVRFPLTDAASFILAYADEVDRDTDMAQFGKFYARNTSFTFLSFVHF